MTRILAFACLWLGAASMTLTAQTTLIHYRLSNANAASVAAGTVPNNGTLGSGTTGTVGTKVTLSSDIPTRGVPTGYGTRSIATSGTGGILAPGSLQLSNSAIAGAGGYTYEAWFKWNGAAGVNSIIDYAGTEKLIRKDTQGGVAMELNNTVDHFIGAAPAGTWVYAAAVFTTTGPVAGDGSLPGKLTLYLDDNNPTAVITGLQKNTFGDSLNRTIGVGMHPAGFSTDFFNGLIYEPRVTLGALPASALLYKPVVSTLADNGAGSLRQVVANSAAGGVVRFDPTLAGKAIVLTGGAMTLNKSLTFDASDVSGGVAISGNHASSIFLITSGSCAFKKLTLQDATGTTVGAVRLNGGASLDIQDCTFSDNTANASATDAVGGAIRSNGTLTIQRSAFLTNQTTASGGGNTYGGAVYAEAGSSLTATNTTFAGNSSANGGAIFSHAPVVLESCTISSNTATSGGGVNNSSGGSLTMNNTIVAGNTATSGANVSGSINSGSNNLTSGDPKLAGATLNGGVIPSMLPLPGSPAIGAAKVYAVSPSTDQRGMARPSLYNSSYALPPATYNESSGGEIGDGVNPKVITLGAGTNTITGSVGPTGGGDQQDALTLMLGTGLRITSASVTITSPDSSSSITFDSGGSGQPASTGGTVSKTFTTPLTGSSYSAFVNTNFATAGRPWTLTVVVDITPSANDIGATEATWDQNSAASVPAGLGTYSDITSTADVIHAVPSDDLADGFAPAAKAVDNTTGHFAVFSPSNGGVTISPALGETTLGGITLTNRQGFSASNAFDPATYELLGSDDLIEFDHLASGSVPAFTSGGSKRTLPFQNIVGPYRHYRLIFPSIIGSSPIVAIQEAELLGVPENSTLRVVGFSVNPSTHQYDLVFASVPGTAYTLQTAQDLDFTPPETTQAVSAGSVTEFTKRVTGTMNPGRDFVRVKTP